MYIYIHTQNRKSFTTRTTINSCTVYTKLIDFSFLDPALLDRCCRDPPFFHRSRLSSGKINSIDTRVWVNTYRYIFSGMNIHLPAILGFTRYQGFDPSPQDFDIPTSSDIQTVTLSNRIRFAKFCG